MSTSTKSERKAVNEQLVTHPLCSVCHVMGKVEPATAVVSVDGELKSVCAEHGNKLEET
jgi:hypothetical protein